MGANCSCLSNKIFYSDIKILEHSKIQNNNFIITNNISKYLNNIIKRQSYIKGYLYRKKQFKPVKLVLSKTNPKKSFKITKANSIKEEELDKLYMEEKNKIKNELNEKINKLKKDNKKIKEERDRLIKLCGELKIEVNRLENNLSLTQNAMENSNMEYPIDEDFNFDNMD